MMDGKVSVGVQMMNSLSEEILSKMPKTFPPPPSKMENFLFSPIDQAKLSREKKDI
jgi:hypothetical protein